MTDLVSDVAGNGHREIATEGPVVIRVVDVPAERTRWLWDGRLPGGKLVVLDGDPGVSKSTLAIDCSARVSTGSPWPDGSPCERGAVVLLSAEDGIGDTIRPRLEAAGADLTRVVVFDGMPTYDDETGDPGPARPPILPIDLGALEEIIRAEGAVLVVVDVLAAFLSGKVDAHRDQDVRGALMPLARLADRTGACIIVIRHLNKAGGANALYRGGGSIGIIGAARAAMLVAPDPDDETRRILCMTKSNLAAMPPALAYRMVNDEEHGCGRIEWDGTTEHRASDLLAFPGAEERTERDSAVEFLVDVLADGPMPAREIKRLARDAGIADRTLDRARARAGVVSRRDGFGRGASYVWVIDSDACTPHVRHARQGSDAGIHGAHVATMTLDDLGAWSRDGLDDDPEASC